MEFLRRLLGGGDRRRTEPAARPRRQPTEEERYGTDPVGHAGQPGLSEDEQAIARYRYLLRTAPPETIEEAHAEAFAQLSPEQRRIVLQQLSANLTGVERTAAERDGDDPRALARTATRAELRQPGTLERSFAGIGGTGLGFGGVFGSSFLGGFSGLIVGSIVADAFFNDGGYDQGYQDGAAAADSADSGVASGDDQTGGNSDPGQYGFGEDPTAGNYDPGFESGDIGGEFGADASGDIGGDIGGDFGGGDFGGGDFGGGDSF